MARFAAWFAVILCLVAAARVGADTSVVAPLIKARTTAAARVYEGELAHYRVGTSDIEHVYIWAVRWADSQRDNHGALPAGAAQEHLKRMQELEQQARLRFSAGVVAKTDVDSAEYYRIEAELWVAQVK